MRCAANLLAATRRDAVRCQRPSPGVARCVPLWRARNMMLTIRLIPLSLLTNRVSQNASKRGFVANFVLLRAPIGSTSSCSAGMWKPSDSQQVEGLHGSGCAPVSAARRAVTDPEFEAQQLSETEQSHRHEMERRHHMLDRQRVAAGIRVRKCEQAGTWAVCLMCIVAVVLISAFRPDADEALGALAVIAACVLLRRNPSCQCAHGDMVRFSAAQRSKSPLPNGSR